MGGILRGDIVWADLDPVIGHEQSGRRPALILSDSLFNKKSRTVIAVALTTQPQKVDFPFAIKLNQEIGKKLVWVKVSHIRTLSTLRLGKKIDHLNERELERVIEALNEIVG